MDKSIEELIVEIVETIESSGGCVNVVRVEKDEETKNYQDLLNFKFKVSETGCSVSCKLNQQIAKCVEEASGLTEKEISEIFKPVEKALDYCARDFSEQYQKGVILNRNHGGFKNEN